jgi:hypothetical protein
LKLADAEEPTPNIGGRRITESFTIEGKPPDPTRPPSGCRFRVPYARTAGMRRDQPDGSGRSLPPNPRTI